MTRTTTNEFDPSDLVNGGLSRRTGNKLNAVIRSKCLLPLEVFDIRQVNQARQQTVLG